MASKVTSTARDRARLPAASDDAAHRKIYQLAREFAQCVNALPKSARADDKFQQKATVVWWRLYEYENLFVLSQVYAINDEFNLEALIEKYKSMAVAREIALISVVDDDSDSVRVDFGSNEIRAEAARDRLLC